MPAPHRDKFYDEGLVSSQEAGIKVGFFDSRMTPHKG